MSFVKKYRGWILNFLFLLIMFLLFIVFLYICMDYDDLDFNYTKFDSGKLSIYDSKDNLIGFYDCKGDIDECYLPLYSEDKLRVTSIVYEDKSEIITSVPVVGGGAFIYDSGDVHYVNIADGKVLSSFKGVKYLNDGFVAVKNSNGKFALGTITLDGFSFVGEFMYDYIGSGNNSDNFLVTVGDYEYMINTKSNLISFEFTKDIVDYNDSVVVIYENNSYNAFRYNGMNYIDETYDFITVDEKFVYAIKDNKLSVFDSNFKLLNDTPVSLPEIDDYNSYKVYTKYHTFVEEIKPIKISYNDKELIITSGDTNNIIVLEKGVEYY